MACPALRALIILIRTRLRSRNVRSSVAFGVKADATHVSEASFVTRIVVLPSSSTAQISFGLSVPPSRVVARRASFGSFVNCRRCDPDAIFVVFRFFGAPTNIVIANDRSRRRTGLRP